MERCANCAHLVESHNLSGCFAGDEEDEVYRCPCPFDYDGRGTFNSKQLPTVMKLRRDLAEAAARNDQVGGDHYRTLKIQPWDIAIEYGLSYIEGSALKYLLRRKANRLEDLRKAAHCLRKLIEIEEGKHV